MQQKDISILMVDDNPSFITRMANLFGELNKSIFIHSAGNYDEALKQLDSRKHDTVLLDINLPGRSGIALLKKIKERNCNCKVIMLSNCSADYYRKQCKKLGAMHFLDKTTDFDIVPSIVADAALSSPYVPC